jgi:hypothetical protein
MKTRRFLRIAFLPELLRPGSHGAKQLSSQLQAPRYFPLSRREKRSELATARERAGVRGIVKRRSVAMTCFSFQQREILNKNVT